MSKKEQLKRVMEDYDSHIVQRIELYWTDGRRSPIGNARAIKAAMDALKAELQRQIDESE